MAELAISDLQLLALPGRDQRLARLWSWRFMETSWQSYIRGGRQVMRDWNAQGFDVKESYYDQHRHFPVVNGADYVNKRLCDQIRDNTISHLREQEEVFVCSGTKANVATYGIL